MNTSEKLISRRRVRRDRPIEDVQHDAYRHREKPKEPAVCPGCGVVFHDGHWSWASRPSGAHDFLCPACERIRDDQPAGWLELSGKFLQQNEVQILALVSKETQRTQAGHPLERIMKVDRQPQKVMVTTTDLHLARRLGDALRRAFHGSLVVKYSADESLVRVYWNREN